MADKKGLVRHKAQNIACEIEALESLKNLLRASLILGDHKASAKKVLEQLRARRKAISELGPLDPEVASEVRKILKKGRQMHLEQLLEPNAIPGLFPNSESA